MRNSRILITVALLIVLAGTATAQDLVDGSDPAVILEIAQGYGTAELSKDSVGDPMVSGRMSGINYVIFFYGCNDAGKECNSLQFRAAWAADGMTHELMNEWNRTKRFGKAYLNQEGNPRIEMNVNLDYGVSWDNLDDTFDWWRIAMEEFLEHLQSR